MKGLCASTPVARTTFYSYYENTSDVLESVEDNLINGLVEVSTKVSNRNLKEMDFHVFLEELEKYIKENWTYMTYIYALLVTQPDLKFMRKWKDAIKINFEKPRFPVLEDLDFLGSIFRVDSRFCIIESREINKSRFLEVMT